MTILKIIMTILEKLQNKWFATAASGVALIIFNLLRPDLWKYVFAILLAYLIADGVKSLFISGRKGAVSIPLLGYDFQHEGHNYIAFLLSIILGTVISGVGAQLVTENIKQITGWQYILLSNFVIIILVYIDFRITFYKRS